MATSASLLIKRSVQDDSFSKRLCAERSILSEVFQQPTYHVKHFVDHSVHEYRCCIFRSDKAGAMGKIIFHFGGHKAGHITVVSIHESCRGVGLGRLLFQECFNVLRVYGISTVFLEAEEDTNRHNKLVGWYQTIGFEPKPGARITYINNNDHQTFRKVPMICLLSALSLTDCFLEDHKQLLPVHLTTPTGMELAVNEQGMLELIDRNRPGAKQWVIAQSAVGAMSLESNFGRFLCAEPSGSVVANRPWQDCWELFDVEVLRHGEYTGGDVDREEIIVQQHDKGCRQAPSTVL